MDLFVIILHTLLVSFIELMYLVGVLIGIGLVVGIIERYIHTFLIRAFGPRGVYITAWIGTPIHEIGHLLMCFIWGHRVTRVRLLQFRNTNGTLGFVEHQYNPNNLFQQIGNFFIGMGPIFSGIGALIAGMYVFTPKSFAMFTEYIHQSVTLEGVELASLRIVFYAFVALCKSLFMFDNILNPWFWIYLIIAICISSHTALSFADIKGATKGLLAIFVFLFFVNIISRLIGVDSFHFFMILAKYNAYVLAFSSITLLFSLLAVIVSYFLYIVKMKIM